MKNHHVCRRSVPVGFRRGFTLVEVLVVVGIIALLIAILLPSLQQARNMAQGTQCASNMKQGVNGALTHLFETGMRKERWNTNFGWATQALRINKKETAIFTCPSDPDPKPVPAVLDRQFDENGNPQGESSADAIFNRVIRKSATTWQTDIQDGATGSIFSGDGYLDPLGDCLIDYEVSGHGQKSASAVAHKDGSNSWRHDIYTYKGSVLWLNVSGNTAPQTLPLMWMSFGANANAGLIKTKGPVILITESGKLGLFPEPLVGTNRTYPADNLARAMRFRHGSRAVHPGLVGADYVNRALGTPPPASGVLGPNQIDALYQPRQRANAGFMDGHVSMLSYYEFFDLRSTLSMPKPKDQIWLGIGRNEGPSSF